MKTRVCLAFLLLIALSGLAAAAPGGAGPNPVAPPAAALATVPAVGASCLAAGAELPLGATASPGFTESLQISPARGEWPLLQRAPCTGCTGTRCMELHSCVLNHCC